MLKKILFHLFSLFLAYRSYELMKKLVQTDPDEFNFGAILFIAFMINLFITGVFAFPGFVFRTSSLLPGKYYIIRHPELLNKLYRLLGVKYFRIALLFAFWGKKKQREKYFNGTRKGLENFIYQTRQSEFGHLSAWISISVCSIILLFKGFYLLVLITSLINFIGNFYPIILQRKHRARISRITSRFK